MHGHRPSLYIPSTDDFHHRSFHNKDGIPLTKVIVIKEHRTRVQMPVLAVNQKGVQVSPRGERDLKRPNPSGSDHGPRCPSREVRHDGDIFGFRMLVSKVNKYFFRFFRDRLPQLRAPACGHDKAKNREQHHRVTTGKQRAPCRGFSDCVHNGSFLSRGSSAGEAKECPFLHQLPSRRPNKAKSCHQDDMCLPAHEGEGRRHVPYQPQAA